MNHDKDVLNLYGQLGHHEKKDYDDAPEDFVQAFTENNVLKSIGLTKVESE
jgi:hypothetical protein